MKSKKSPRAGFFCTLPKKIVAEIKRQARLQECSQGVVVEGTVGSIYLHRAARRK